MTPHDPTRCAPAPARRLASMAAAVVLALGAAAATAQTSSAAGAAASPAMGFQQVVERVTALGLRDVREVERKGDKLFEVTARDDQGRWVELLIDARSGEVLKQETKAKR